MESILISYASPYFRVRCYLIFIARGKAYFKNLQICVVLKHNICVSGG